MRVEVFRQREARGFSSSLCSLPHAVNYLMDLEPIKKQAISGGALELEIRQSQ